jgi:hypothetical protein
VTAGTLYKSLFPAATEERSYFVAIAAGLHGAPAAAMRAGIIVKEKAACGIATAANRNAGTFDQQLRRGTSDGRKQPFQSVLARDELERPGAAVGDEFVVAFGDAENFVDGFDPGTRILFTLHQGGKDSPETFAEAEDAQKNRVNRLRLVQQERAQASGTVLRNQAGIDQKGNEFVPGEIMSRRRGIGEVESETSGDEGVAGIQGVH